MTLMTVQEMEQDVFTVIGLNKKYLKTRHQTRSFQLDSPWFTVVMRTIYNS